MTTLTAKPKSKKKKKKLSAEERAHARVKREHAKLIKTSFRAAGFSPIASAADKEFHYDGASSDFDDVFVYENVIVLCEYTTSQESNVSAHLKNKKIIYDKILANVTAFLEFFFERFPEVRTKTGQKYSIHQFRLKICYCSLNTLKYETKSLVPSVVFMDYNVAKYFDALGKTIKLSSRFEMFDFLGLSSKEVADGVLTAASTTQTFQGSILPESHSNFGDGFKVVSFYIDPAALLQRAYVLRKYGWRDGGAVYQRMIARTKITSVRRYLRDERRVFINNIIVTLPHDTKLLDEDGDTINPKELQDTRPGIIQIPTRFNTVGIIDGQHRVFSYHEGGLYEEDIAKLRVQQNLLVTGLVFPKHMNNEERLQFEARLFLEINSNQTNAKSDLKQEINLIINPFSPDSIAKRVANYINDNNGPLRDEFERFFFEKGKLKTTSVVSFALKPLVSPYSKSSFYRIWSDPEKSQILKGNSSDTLNEYVKFCGAEINKVFSAVKANLPNERWTTDRNQPKRFLTTVNVNGVLGALRRVVGANNLQEFHQYNSILKEIDKFPFENFRSSQYNKMGEKLFDEYFRQDPPKP